MGGGNRVKEGDGEGESESERENVGWSLPDGNEIQFQDCKLQLATGDKKKKMLRKR